MITVIIIFLDMFTLEKKFNQLFNISEILHESQSPKVVFWKGWDFNVSWVCIGWIIDASVVE